MYTSGNDICMHLDCCHVQVYALSTVTLHCWNMHIDYMYTCSLDAWPHVYVGLEPTYNVYYMIQQNT